MTRRSLLFYSTFLVIQAIYLKADNPVYVAPVTAYTITNNTGGIELSNGDTVTLNRASNSVLGLIIGSNAFLSIQNAINEVDESGTVFIAAGAYDESVEILIEKGVTLQGDGEGITLLSGGSNGDDVFDVGEHRVLVIDALGFDIFLNDLSIIRGVALTEAEEDGGGILLNDGYVSINNCSILDNSALTSGGGIYRGGGAFTDRGSCSITNTMIKNNHAASGGGIYCRDESIIIDTCEFNSNTASSEGGAISHRGSNLIISNSLFRENISTQGNGGGINIFAGEVIDISSTVFEGNSALYGGALYLNHTANITNTDFIKNNAENGGAMYLRDTLTMDKVDFRENIATSNGGGMVNFGGIVTANQVSFSGNRIEGEDVGEGGGLSNRGIFTGSNMRFTENTAVYGDGGAIANRDDLTMTDLIVHDNSVTFADPIDPPFGAFADGGGIYNSGNGNIDITNASISGNFSQNDGGGIYTQGFYSLIKLESTTLSGNTALEKGGGISGDSHSVELINCTVSENQATDGGGIYDWSDSFTLTHCTVTGNHATQDGGGVNRLGSSVAGVYTNSILAGNSKGRYATDTRGDFAGTGVNFIGINNSTYAGYREGTDLSFSSTGTSSTSEIFTNLSDNGGSHLTHALVLNSPAINSGDNTALPPSIINDQRGDGFVRIYDGTVDIGALEFSDQGADLSLSIIEISETEGVILNAALVPGQIYMLEYSEDLVTFTPAYSEVSATGVPFIATTNYFQITDNGPPLSLTPPSSAAKRFYRVIKMED